MTADIILRFEACIGQARSGVFDEVAWRQLFRDALSADGQRRQRLLYIQGSSTNVGAPALGMSLVDGTGGQLSGDPERWPYQTVLEAMADGWRIISFPDLALLGDARRPHGLGCEFILEKWQ